jgi:hypothetical protein
MFAAMVRSSAAFMREQYREKAHEARQRPQSPDPDVRNMWRAIARQYDYLAGIT